MKILVHFKHEFFTRNVLGEIDVKMHEIITKVFEAKSDSELLDSFDKWDFVPFHLRRLTSKFIHSGKKTMIWYLPESHEPHIKE